MPSRLPSLQQHHHHSMALPGPQPPLSSHTMGGRPQLDRAHTFPTPPTSASSVMGNMGASDNYQWGQQGMSSAQGPNPISIDTTLSNARSMPASPGPTPPGSSLQTMQHYPPATQPYDNTRQLYNAPPSQQSPYPPVNTSPQDRSVYGQTPYVKSEMGPPSSRPAGTGPGGEQTDNKPNGMMHPSQGGESHPGAEDEAEHEHDSEYTHDNSGYGANRTSSFYNQPAAPLPSDHQHLSPELTNSANHTAASGRSTPRSAAQSYYPQQGYTTSPRPQQAPSSNVYNVVSDDRGSTNGGAQDLYAQPQEMGGSMQNGYGAPLMNGAGSGMKRGRDDEDDRPSSGGPGMGGMDLKRRKTMLDGTVPSPGYDTMNRPPSAISAPVRRR